MWFIIGLHRFLIYRQFAAKNAVLPLVVASVDAEILYQKWMTTDPKIIPVARIRADCRDGDLVTSAGLAPFTRTSLINVTVVLPPQYNDCTQNSRK